jgi:S-adenosylmethionine hydrolase
VSKVVSTYADVESGQVSALFGSTDHLEIAANGTSAAQSLDLSRGALVRISRRA